MTNEDQKLREMQAQIDALKAKNNPRPAPKAEADAQSMSLGMRAGTELVGTIGGSALIGYGLDRWLESKPWGLIILLVLGTGAAFYNVYKTTQNAGSAVGYKKPRAD